MCGWIVFGFLAGLVARAIMPGKQSLGFIATTLLGVGGAFVGGLVVSLLRGGGGAHWPSLEPGGFIGAVLGALALLAVGEAMKKRRH